MEIPSPPSDSAGEHNPGLRVAVLLHRGVRPDPDTVELIRDLNGADFVARVAVMRVPESAAARRPFSLSLAWRAYQWIERRMAPPVSSADQNAFFDVEEWREPATDQRWDVLLCQDFDDRMAGLARHARGGLWWISMDPQPARNPDLRCQLRAMLRAPEPLRVALWRIRAAGDSPDLLETASVRQVSGFSLRRNLTAIEPLRRQLWMAMLAKFRRDGSPSPRLDEGTSTGPSTVRFAAPALARLAVRQFRLRAQLRHRVEAWQVGIRPLRGGGGAYDNPEGYRWLQAPANCWLADPCPIEVDGKTWLFVEKFSAARGLGEICCCEVRDDGSTGPLMDVLSRPYHLSYPHVFRHNGDIFMIPESGANNTVELYRAVDFPLRWELLRILYQGPAFDTTVMYSNDRFWFFTSFVEGTDRVASRLMLFHSDRPDADWHLHPASPLSMDARWSRCGGRLFVQDGSLIRPAQDCSRLYGGSIKFRAITMLNQREHCEETRAELTPAAWRDTGAIGVHTYDRAGRIEVIDRLVSSRPA